MSKEINLPPFFVGQKIVAVKNSLYGAYKKEDLFIIQDIRKSCCDWEIDIGITAPTKTMSCEKCGRNEIGNKCWWFSPSDFAPIHENFQSISLEKVLEEETKLIGVN